MNRSLVKCWKYESDFHDPFKTSPIIEIEVYIFFYVQSVFTIYIKYRAPGRIYSARQKKKKKSSVRNSSSSPQSLTAPLLKKKVSATAQQSIDARYRAGLIELCASRFSRVHNGREVTCCRRSNGTEAARPRPKENPDISGRSRCDQPLDVYPHHQQYSKPAARPCLLERS